MSVQSYLLSLTEFKSSFQWFPGHMTKALREFSSKLSKVDGVVEIVDARIPQSSSNPMIESVIQGTRPIIKVLNKSNFAKRIFS